MDFIETIEKDLGQEAIKNFLPMQSGDVKDNLTDTSLLENWMDYRPLTILEDGINKFIHRYQTFNKEF